ncbi:MAG: zf-HC2 domain-containing protein [Leptolinea sp.]|nr:zf-HC2 domain-containing protein [Leptolinea sp.]
MKDNLKAQEWEMLSAYLDGGLTPEETRQVKTRLSTDSNWQAALLALKKTRDILRFVPDVKRRRSFFLTEDMVCRRSWFWLTPTMNHSSIAVAILAVIFLLVDFLPLAVNPAAMAPQMESAPLIMETTTEKQIDDGQANAVPVEIRPDSMMEQIPEMVDSMSEIAPTEAPGFMTAPPPAELKGEPSYSVEEADEGAIGELDTGSSPVEPSGAGNIVAVPAPSQAVSGEDPSNATPTGLRSFAATATTPAEKSVQTFSPTPSQAKSGVETELLATSSPDLTGPEFWTDQKNETAPGKVPHFRLSDIALILLTLSIILAVAGFILKKALRE